MVTPLCYKCSQRKAVVDAKLRARSGGVVRSDPETREFEAYLYHQNPLCNQCTALIGEASRGVVTSRHNAGGSVRDDPRHTSKTRTLAMVAVALAIVAFLVLSIILYHTHYASISVTLTTQLAHNISYLNDVIKLSRDVINMSLNVSATLVNGVDLGTVYYPRDFDGMMYTVVLAIQVTTVALRQHHKASIAASILSYLVYTFQPPIPGVDKIYLEVARYSLLAIAVLLVFTKKSTVVTVSQRKNTQKPVIKVRRSPKKRADSPLAVNSAFFSDDEDFKPTNQSWISDSSTNLSSVNQSTIFESRDLQVSDQRSEPLPLKDVSSKFNIMKISGSPVKSPYYSAERTPNRRHASCLKPARFSLDKPLERPASPAPTSQQAVSGEEKLERARFDSTCSDELPPVQEKEKVNDNLPLTPIIIVLVLSVVTNYYLLVHYVLAT